VVASTSSTATRCASGRRCGRTEPPARLFCLALVEFNSKSSNCADAVRERLFAGHSNGNVSEWDLESRSCVAVYGDARSGAGVCDRLRRGLFLRRVVKEWRAAASRQRRGTWLAILSAEGRGGWWWRVCD
jgi:hypothetical protein